MTVDRWQSASGAIVAFAHRKASELIATCCLLVVLTATLASPAVPTSAALTRTSSGAPILWGAAIGTQYTGSEPPWDMRALRDFERITHKAPSIVSFYSDFANCTSSCHMLGFPTSLVGAIRRNGAVPMISWASEAEQSPEWGGSFTLADIADGSLDGYLKRFARSAARWGHPFFLRFDWEMNGYWTPWGLQGNGNTPAEYVAAWRHVHDVFDAEGATNATWVWCPNVGIGRSATTFYPGNSYVDWTCLDGYNWGSSNPQWGGWKSFSRIYRGSYNELRRVAPSKPVMVGEFASTDVGGSKPRWIRNALAVIPTQFPAIRAIVYFDNSAGGMAWPLMTSSNAEQAFAAGIADPVYQRGHYATLSGGAVTASG